MSKTTSLPYLDRLDSGRQKIFKELAAFAVDFTLAVGTAIMLQIGHRYSVDFDLFSEKKLSPRLLNKSKIIFGQSITPDIDTDDILSVITSDGITVTFVFHPYPPLQKPLKTGSLPFYHLD